MEKRNGFVEFGLDRGTAGGFETDRADVFRRHSTMLVLLRKRLRHEPETHTTHHRELLHISPPVTLRFSAAPQDTTRLRCVGSEQLRRDKPAIPDWICRLLTVQTPSVPVRCHNEPAP